MTMPSLFSDFESTPDLWEMLAVETRDILLYGMGNGADKILAVLEKKQIKIAEIFASDGFARGQVFHGKTVLSFSEICAKYEKGSAVVLLAFGSARAEVIALFDKVADRYPLFVPDVPVAGDTLFDRAFFIAHKEELAAARAALADKESSRIFDLVIAAKLTGRYEYFARAVSAPDTMTFLDLSLVRRAADFGAYTGDSVRDLLVAAPGCFRVTCAEPDRRSFKKLAAYASAVKTCDIVCHRAAVCGVDGAAHFEESGNRGAGLADQLDEKKLRTKLTSLPAVRPDTILEGAGVDYIKLDIEGAEYAALCGARRTIEASRPILKIACYHRSEDLFLLPLLLRTIAPEHKLYLRRTHSIPSWDLDLFAIPDSRLSL